MLLLSKWADSVVRARCVLPRSRFNPVWKFQYQVQGQNCDMRFTSIAGHLQARRFAAPAAFSSPCSDVQAACEI